MAHRVEHCLEPVICLPVDLPELPDVQRCADATEVEPEESAGSEDESDSSLDDSDTTAPLRRSRPDADQPSR